MSKTYQRSRTEASEPELSVPEEVGIALAEIVESAREGLLALAVGAGLRVMQAMMKADVAAACGPRGKHDPQRVAVRHGREPGSSARGGDAHPAGNVLRRYELLAGAVYGLGRSRAFPAYGRS